MSAFSFFVDAKQSQPWHRAFVCSFLKSTTAKIFLMSLNGISSRSPLSNLSSCRTHTLVNQGQRIAMWNANPALSWGEVDHIASPTQSPTVLRRHDAGHRAISSWYHGRQTLVYNHISLQFSLLTLQRTARPDGVRKFTSCRIARADQSSSPNDLPASNVTPSLKIVFHCACRSPWSLSTRVSAKRCAASATVHSLSSSTPEENNGKKIKSPIGHQDTKYIHLYQAYTFHHGYMADYDLLLQRNRSQHTNEQTEEPCRGWLCMPSTSYTSVYDQDENEWSVHR